MWIVVPRNAGNNTLKNVFSIFSKSLKEEKYFARKSIYKATLNKIRTFPETVGDFTK